MANAIYPKYKQAVLNGEANVDLDHDDAVDGPYCALVNPSIYTYSSAHQFYTDLSGIIGTDQRIVTPVVNSSGTFDGGDIVYTGVSGTMVGALVIYRKNAGASSTWRLVSYYDTPGNGLPLTPTGGNITVTWNAAGIFTL